MSALPPVAELVPHGGPMRLVGRVLEHDGSSTTCAVDPARSLPFLRPDGSVPCWIGLEYMAQCAAAHGGLVGRQRGLPPRPGLFLGSRRVRFRVDAFRRPLRVTARHHRGETGLVAFDCSIREGDEALALAEGRITLYVFRDWQALEERIHGS